MARRRWSGAPAVLGDGAQGDLFGRGRAGRPSPVVAATGSSRRLPPTAEDVALGRAAVEAVMVAFELRRREAVAAAAAAAVVPGSVSLSVSQIRELLFVGVVFAVSDEVRAEFGRRCGIDF